MYSIFSYDFSILVRAIRKSEKDLRGKLCNASIRNSLFNASLGGRGILLGGGEDREKGFIFLVQFPLFANEVRRTFICLKLCSISELAKLYW